MPDPRQLPYLIKLLDDDSPMIRKRIVAELRAFGPSLEDEIVRLPESPTPAQKARLQDILEEHSRTWLRKNWLAWLDIPYENEKLEAAHALIADFQNGRHYPAKLKDLLDLLAAQYTDHHVKQDPFSLSNFLFKAQRLRGARTDLKNPHLSNLVYVIEEGAGLPISLASIFILVGHRLNMAIEGCNYPGHFLARVYVGKDMYLVDGYEGGRFLTESDILAMNPALPGGPRGVLRSAVPAAAIMERVLRNLSRAYADSGDNANGVLLQQLLEEMRKRRIVDPPIP
ncbi:MAG: transglutaminase family protein [Planctomycetota bacterium]